jgi:hypothetical protein
MRISCSTLLRAALVTGLVAAFSVPASAIAAAPPSLKCGDTAPPCIQYCWVNDYQSVPCGVRLIPVPGAHRSAPDLYPVLDCRDAARSAQPDTPCVRYCRIYDTTGVYPCGIEGLPGSSSRSASRPLPELPPIHCDPASCTEILERRIERITDCASNTATAVGYVIEGRPVEPVAC